MHSGETETIEKPVAKTQKKSAPRNFVATPNTVATFTDRHIGQNEDEVAEELRSLGYDNLDDITRANVHQNDTYARTHQGTMKHSRTQIKAEQLNHTINTNRM